MHPILTSIFRQVTKQRLLILLCLSVPFILESIWHTSSKKIPRPDISLDAPFVTQCVEPDTAAPRENATAMMLARNEDIHGAKQAIESWEQQFNRFFHYPVVFFNDKPWSRYFIEELSAVASGPVSFETVPRSMWDYPEFIDREAAKQSIKEQGKMDLLNAGRESYHHMCRFYSGLFYDHPALQKYEYFWRIEPEVMFQCAIPYDPFRKMREEGKKYGYAIALWEVGDTSPSLFRAVADYKDDKDLPSNSLWGAMVDTSWAPWPVRKLLAHLAQHRDSQGDKWNHCHFWSNFEIASMSFFRSQEYRDLFDYLDHKGGFYFERWGDAPVHSLAVALFLRPEEIHCFEDLGYGHPPFWACPQNAWKGQLLESESLGAPFNLSTEREDGMGCRCSCFEDDENTNFNGFCFDKFDKALKAKAAWW